MQSFLDSHIHLDFMEGAHEIALRAAELERKLLANSISPYGFMKLRMRFPGNPWIKPALGFHPWWVAAGVLQPADLLLFERLAPEAPFIGEVGLDFMGPRKESAQDQLDAFDRIIEACVQPLACPSATERHQRVISIHAVKSAAVVLDVLERWDATSDNACIFHWFTGSSDELQRAISLGCFFSVGERMLRSKKGRAYVNAIPPERILLETDAPGSIDAAPWDSALFAGEAPVPDARIASMSCDDWEASLLRAANLYEAATGHALPCALQWTER